MVLNKHCTLTLLRFCTLGTFSCTTVRGATECVCNLHSYLELIETKLNRKLLERAKMRSQKWICAHMKLVTWVSR